MRFTAYKTNPNTTSLASSACADMSVGALGGQLFWGAIGLVSSLMLLGAAKTTPRLKRWLQGESFSTTRDRNASDTFYDPPPTQGEVYSPF